MNNLRPQIPRNLQPKIVPENIEYLNKLFERIKQAIPKLCEDERAAEFVESVAVDIYLTATEIRPACYPFDGCLDSESKTLYGNDMQNKLKANPELLTALEVIEEIKVIRGPFYCVKDGILILNRRLYDSGFFTLIFDEMNAIIDRTDGKCESEPRWHILAGTMLGYTCPIDLDKILSGKKRVYSIDFEIDGDDHMGVWCPVERQYIDKALDQLDKMNAVLIPIDKQAILKISNRDFESDGYIYNNNYVPNNIRVSAVKSVLSKKTRRQRRMARKSRRGVRARY